VASPSNQRLLYKSTIRFGRYRRRPVVGFRETTAAQDPGPILEPFTAPDFNSRGFLLWLLLLCEVLARSALLRATRLRVMQWC
jgi:hypothetical protein